MEQLYMTIGDDSKPNKEEERRYGKVIICVDNDDGKHIRSLLLAFS